MNYFKVLFISLFLIFSLVFFSYSDVPKPSSKNNTQHTLKKLNDEKKEKKKDLENQNKNISPEIPDKKPITSDQDKIIKENDNEKKNTINIDTKILAMAAIFPGLVALFLPFLFKFLEWKRRPILELCFNEKIEEPYFKSLVGNFGYKPIELDGNVVRVFLPTLNSRLKVRNKGKATAKNVQTRVEKVELLTNGNLDRIIHYHPTKIKWSGEFYWTSVDIVKDSYFFLDLFYSANAKIDSVNDFLYDLYNRQLSKTQVKFLVDRAPIVDDIFWNLWVEDPKNRGIDEHFYHEGEIKISFIINGENINSLKFTAEINWTKEKWDKPTIKIEHNGKYIHDCVKGDSENAKKPR